MWYYYKNKAPYLNDCCIIGNRYWISEFNFLFNENMSYIRFIYDSEIRKCFESLLERRMRLIEEIV